MQYFVSEFNSASDGTRISILQLWKDIFSKYIGYPLLMYVLFWPPDCFDCVRLIAYMQTKSGIHMTNTHNWQITCVDRKIFWKYIILLTCLQ